MMHAFIDDGFGLTLEGGSDRPLYQEDAGIFIIRIRQGSNADKIKQLEAGDKILEVRKPPLRVICGTQSPVI